MSKQILKITADEYITDCISIKLRAEITRSGEFEFHDYWVSDDVEISVFLDLYDEKIELSLSKSIIWKIYSNWFNRNKRILSDSDNWENIDKSDLDYETFKDEIE